MKIETVPESIISQARHILQSKTYSSTFRRDIIRQVIGTCSVCSDLPTKYIIDKQDGINVISRYCQKDFEIYNNKKRKRK